MKEKTTVTPEDTYSGDTLKRSLRKLSGGSNLPMKLDGLHKLTRKMYKEVLEPAKAQKNKY